MLQSLFRTRRHPPRSGLPRPTPLSPPPPRHRGVRVLAGLGLFLAGGVAGLVLGLSLPPPPAPGAAAAIAPAATAPTVAEAPQGTGQTAATAGAAERDGLLAELETLRQSLATEQGRLEATTQARTAIEAELARLR